MDAPGFDRNHPFFILLPLGLVMFLIVSLATSVYQGHPAYSEVGKLAGAICLFLVFLTGRTDLGPRLKTCLRWGTGLFILTTLAGLLLIRLGA